jgi:hypothetical protein
MSSGWRAVAAWIARVFLRRGPRWVEPRNTIAARALSEDLHLPFEAFSLTPTSPDPTAPAEGAAPDKTAAA